MTTDTLHQRLHNMSPERRRYALLSLPAHLARAGQVERLRSALTDLYYLEAKITLFGSEPAISDYDLAPVSPNHGNSLELVQGALRLSAHVLSEDVRQLAGQLLGRLQSYDDTDLQQLLGQARRWEGATWLRPLAPSLTPPGGSLVRTLIGHTGAVTAVAVTPDGLHAVSASADRTLRVWDIATGESVMTLSGHTAEVNAVAVTPDGRYAVSASSDATLKVWDLRDGSEHRTLRGHTDEVHSVVVLPNSRHVVSDPAPHLVRLTRRSESGISTRPKRCAYCAVTQRGSTRCWHFTMGIASSLPQRMTLFVSGISRLGRRSARCRVGRCGASDVSCQCTMTRTYFLPREIGRSGCGISRAARRSSPYPVAEPFHALLSPFCSAASVLSPHMPTVAWCSGTLKRGWNCRQCPHTQATSLP